MIWLVAATAWITLTAGLYLALARDLLRIVVGLSLTGNAVVLMLLASGRLDSPAPAVIAAGETVLADAANPLPQALVLTAIVIGFALTCFALVLVKALAGRVGHADTGALHLAEPQPDDPVKPPLPVPGTGGERDT